MDKRKTQQLDNNTYDYPIDQFGNLLFFAGDGQPLATGEELYGSVSDALGELESQRESRAILLSWGEDVSDYDEEIANILAYVHHHDQIA